MFTPEHITMIICFVAGFVLGFGVLYLMLRATYDEEGSNKDNRTAGDPRDMR